MREAGPAVAAQSRVTPPPVGASGCRICCETLESGQRATERAFEGAERSKAAETAGLPSWRGRRGGATPSGSGGDASPRVQESRDRCHPEGTQLRGRDVSTVPPVEVVEIGPTGRRPRAEGFEAFYVAEYPRLVALARGLAGAEQAEDVAQEAVAVACRRWREVSAKDRPDLWVRRTCSNLAVSSFRRRIREARLVTRLVSRRAEPPAMPPASEEFWAAVGRLPSRQAQASALRFVYDMPVAEIAAVLRCSEDTVKQHLSRALFGACPRPRNQGGRRMNLDERVHRASIDLLDRHEAAGGRRVRGPDASQEAADGRACRRRRRLCCCRRWCRCTASATGATPEPVNPHPRGATLDRPDLRSRSCRPGAGATARAPPGRQPQQRPRLHAGRDRDGVLEPRREPRPPGVPGRPRVRRGPRPRGVPYRLVRCGPVPGRRQARVLRRERIGARRHVRLDEHASRRRPPSTGLPLVVPRRDAAGLSHRGRGPRRGRRRRRPDIGLAQ